MYNIDIMQKNVLKVGRVGARYILCWLRGCCEQGGYQYTFQGQAIQFWFMGTSSKNTNISDVALLFAAIAQLNYSAHQRRCYRQKQAPVFVHDVRTVCVTYVNLLCFSLFEIRRTAL